MRVDGARCAPYLTSFRKDLHRKFIEALDREKIKYELIELEGKKWVVWPLEDSEKVNLIIQDISLSSAL